MTNIKYQNTSAHSDIIAMVDNNVIAHTQWEMVAFMYWE